MNNILQDINPYAQPRSTQNSVIPDLELNKNAAPTTPLAKLLYLQSAHNDLQQRYEECQASLLANKSILVSTLQVVEALRSGNIELDTYKQYADDIILKLQQQNKSLYLRLDKEQEARIMQTSRALITAQIREEDEQSYRDMIKEYEEKISNLRMLVQDKQRYIQLLEESEVEYQLSESKPKGPSREIMKLIDNYEVNFTVVQKLKDENDTLKIEVSRLQSELKSAEAELICYRNMRKKSSERKRSPKSIYKDENMDFPLGELSENTSYQCQQGREPSTQNSQSVARYMKKSPFKASLIDMGQKQRISNNNQQAARNSGRKNESLLQCVVSMYKKEQLNCKLITRKYRQLEISVTEMQTNYARIVEANKNLEKALRELRKEFEVRQILSREGSAAQPIFTNCHVVQAFDLQSPRKSLISGVQKARLKQYMQKMYSQFQQKLGLFLVKKRHNGTIHKSLTPSLSQKFITHCDFRPTTTTRQSCLPKLGEGMDEFGESVQSEDSFNIQKSPGELEDSKDFSMMLDTGLEVHIKEPEKIRSSFVKKNSATMEHEQSLFDVFEGGLEP